MSAVDVAEMSLPEKLSLMETLWDSLCTRSNITIPAWHAEVLEARMQRLTDGSEPVSSWREGKTRLRSPSACNDDPQHRLSG